MTATENVEKFLTAWEKLDDHAVIAGTVSPDGSRVSLATENVAAVLDEVVELREQLADRIVPVESTDTVVHLQNPPIDYGLPPGVPVRFITGPGEGEYIQVRTIESERKYVLITAWPNMEIRTLRADPGLPGAIAVRPARP